MFFVNKSKIGNQGNPKPLRAKGFIRFEKVKGRTTSLFPGPGRKQKADKQHIAFALVSTAVAAVAMATNPYIRFWLIAKFTE